MVRSPVSRTGAPPITLVPVQADRADAPIGILDSGVGGLTVARAVLDQLPHEGVLYVGDTAHGPYGPLPIAQVRAHALDVMDHLVEVGVKMLVIACNSASAATLRDARERYAVPVIEVIAPAVRRAVAASRSGAVGVIGTRATITSRAYEDAFAAAPHLQLTTRPCPRFVEFVEAGVTAGEELLACARRELREETGLVARSFEPLLSELQLSNSVSDERAWLFVARGLTQQPKVHTFTLPNGLRVVFMEKSLSSSLVRERHAVSA